jgi:hypothetical protein
VIERVDYSSKLTSIKGSDLKLIRMEVRMPRSDVDQLLDFEGETFEVPAISRKHGRCVRVDLPGEWIPARPVGGDAPHDRGVLPWFPGLVWLTEREFKAPGAAAKLGERGTTDVLSKLKADLGVDLSAVPERLGAFLVVWPETRLRVDVTGSKLGTRIGVRTATGSLDPADLTLTVQGFNGGDLIGAQVITAPAPFVWMDFPIPVDQYKAQILHRTDGMIYSDGGPFLRNMHFKLETMTSDRRSLIVQPRTAEGEAVGPPAQISAAFGVPTSIATGNVEPWELRRRAARDRRSREELIDSGTLRIFRGGADSRSQAVTYLRALVGEHHDGPLRIWDEYFSGVDLLLLLGSLKRVGTPVHILSGESKAWEHAEKRLTYGGALEEERERAWRPSILDVARGFDHAVVPTRRKHGIEHRRGGNFHDRFLITDAACYQLGSSINSLGKAFSTVMRLPDRHLVLAEFMRAWESADVGK